MGLPQADILQEGAMRFYCNIIRDGFTATSAFIDTIELNDLRRWMLSSVRHSGSDASRYHLIAYSNMGDISGTDLLEEVTGTLTGVVFRIINKREVTGSHLEFDLEKK